MTTSHLHNVLDKFMAILKLSFEMQPINAIDSNEQARVRLAFFVRQSSASLDRISSLPAASVKARPTSLTSSRSIISFDWSLLAIRCCIFEVGV
jgi:hypothetical protein